MVKKHVLALAVLLLLAWSGSGGLALHAVRRHDFRR